MPRKRTTPTKEQLLEEAVKDAQAELERVRARWKYLPGDPEGEKQIRRAEEDLEALKHKLGCEQRRIAGSKAAAARVWKRKEQEAKQSAEQATKELPELVQGMERAALDLWRGVAAWAERTSQGLEELEELADILDLTRSRVRKAARTCGELRHREGAPQYEEASEALRELFASERSKADSPPEAITKDLADRIRWAVTLATSIGARSPEMPNDVSYPLASPSIAEYERQRRRKDERRQDTVRRWEEARLEADRRLQERQEQIRRRIAERLPEAREYFADRGLTSEELERYALERARSQAILDPEGGERNAEKS